MVSYKKFLKVVANELSDFLPEPYDEAEIKVVTTSKKFKRPYDGIQVKMPDSEVGLCYDLKRFYSAMTDMGELDSVLHIIAREVVMALNDQPPNIEELLDDLDYLKHNLIIDVVNKETKGDELEDMPYKLFGDIAVYFRLLFINHDGEMYTTCVTNDIFKRMNMTEDEIFELAAVNSSRMFPIDILNFRGRIATPAPRFETKRDENGDLIYPDNMDFMYMIEGHGADCMFYPNFIDEVAYIVGRSFFICPFCTKAIMIMMDIGDISEPFVKEYALKFYTTACDESIRLTKNVFYYDYDTGTVGPIEDYRHKLLQPEDYKCFINDNGVWKEVNED